MTQAAPEDQKLEITGPIVSLTKYIWPLNKPVLLSEKLGFSIKNVHNRDVPLLAQRLRAQILQHGSHIFGHDYETVEKRIISMQTDSFNLIKKMGFKGIRRNPWEFMAANWVILESSKDYGDLSHDDHSITSDVVESYASLLDFYRGIFLRSTASFINDGQFIPHKQIYSLIQDIRVGGSLEYLVNSLDWYTNGYEGENIHDVLFDDDLFTLANQTIVHIAISDIRECARALEDSHIIGSSFEESYFLGSMIDACFSKSQSWHMKVLMLCSILEYLIARNPDPKSFNVDESINRQFQMKSALIANRFDESFELESTAKFLKIAYNIRSKIAHGDFASLKKELSKSKIDTHEFEQRLHKIAIACLRIAVEEPEYSVFIKNS